MALFAASHSVPAGGLDTWSRPDGNLAADNRLAAGLDVKLLEQRPDGWAHVECSNGWTAWVDGRWLLALAPSPVVTAAAAPPTAAPLPPPAAAPSFVAAPFPGALPLAPLRSAAPPAPPGVLHPAAPAVAATAAAPGAGSGAAAAPAATTLGAGLMISLGGAALVAISALMPWVSISQLAFSASALQLPIGVLFGFKASGLLSPAGAGFSIGFALLLAAAAAVAGIFTPRLGLVRRAAGLAAVLAPTALLAQLQRQAVPGLNTMQFIGIGVWLAAFGGVLLLVGGARKAA
ncbi:MAG TPA: hypothetical protein VG245_02595 [Candidatus Dormibacteraeota bacterium]|jgi:hypothetical protein|nr:hypothetical protein [Candidatus Dormibacteraeota bacterium]